MVPIAVAARRSSSSAPLFFVCLLAWCHCLAFALVPTSMPSQLDRLRLFSSQMHAQTRQARNHGSQILRALALQASNRREFDDQPSHLPSSQSIKQEWIDRSLDYYRKVMREERRLKGGQVKDYDTKEYQDGFTQLANKHYFALRKIKDGKPRHAERIYRRIIDELLTDDDNCDHAKLAVTTLLLALLLQRMHAPAKETRAVFLHFFRVAILESPEGECACSAKVLGAYALFEMRHGNALKSVEIAARAVKLDPTLAPMLQWKQFRDAAQRRVKAAATFN
ncbi:hypothetical protein MPSEU_000805500 [Mayamaea pseudoterrestris]|nr:hypothetical protein MPSEU_000805500 [Mayamaea pseudoterrestris]